MPITCIFLSFFSVDSNIKAHISANIDTNDGNEQTFVYYDSQTEADIGDVIHWVSGQPDDNVELSIMGGGLSTVNSDAPINYFCEIPATGQ